MTARPLRPASSRAGGTDWHWLTSALEMGAMAGGNGWLMTDPAHSDQTRAPRTATRTPGADARSVRETRDFTMTTLRRWDVADRLDDIVVVVSELLTNAIRHAQPVAAGQDPHWPIRLDLLQSGPCVLCMVADPSDQPPVPRDPGCLAEAGRGLQIIAALSDQWGFTTPSEMGKVVWAMFSTRPGSPL
jgi:anti-sigma regulatory factor (Ser/Thr protein kinase)